METDEYKTDPGGETVIQEDTVRITTDFQSKSFGETYIVTNYRVIVFIFKKEDPKKNKNGTFSKRQ